MDLLQQKTVKELRTLARQELSGIVSGIWIAGASKDSLIEAITNKVQPESKPAIPAALLGDPMPERQTKSQWLKEQNKPDNNGDLGQMLANLVGQHIKIPDAPQIDENQIRIIAENIVKSSLNDKVEEIKKGMVHSIEYTKQDETKIKLDTVHKNFALMLSAVSARQFNGQSIPIFLSGPAGSGKTTGAHNLADCLGLNFFCVSVGAQTTKTDLMGYMDATGKYQESSVYKAYHNGGVLLLDEIDAGNANTLTMLNALLGNGVCGFPCGMVTRHKDFTCIVAGNTWGYGASREYVGRNKLDAAFLNRFLFIPWDYDNALENKLCGILEFSEYIQAIRKTVIDLKIRIVVSPRASIYGSGLLRAGLKIDQVMDLVLWNSTGVENKEKVLNTVNFPKPEYILPKEPVKAIEPAKELEGAV